MNLGFKILVVDDYHIVPGLLRTDIDWMWKDAGGASGACPEVLVARNWRDAIDLLDRHAEELVGVLTDALIELSTLDRSPDEQHCGPALFWKVRRHSASIPVIIYSMGGLNEYLFEKTGLNALPPEDGTWKFLARGMTVENLAWLEMIVAYAAQKATS